jgi:hypothetical protein
MHSGFKKGVLTGLAIYGAGILVTVILHFIFGWDYHHAPPTSAIAIFITLATGAARLLITTGRVIRQRSAAAKGELVVHVIIALLIVLFFLWMNYKY